jgi:hypothetical protein
MGSAAKAARTHSADARLSATMATVGAATAEVAVELLAPVGYEPPPEALRRLLGLLVEQAERLREPTAS